MKMGIPLRRVVPQVLAALACAVVSVPVSAQTAATEELVKKEIEKATAQIIAKLEEQGKEAKKVDCEQPEVVFDSLTHATYHVAKFTAKKTHEYQVCIFLVRQQKKGATGPGNQALPESALWIEKAGISPPSSCAELAGTATSSARHEIVFSGTFQIGDPPAERGIVLDRFQFTDLLKKEGWLEVVTIPRSEECKNKDKASVRLVPMIERHELIAGLGAAFRAKEEGGFDAGSEVLFQSRSRWRRWFSTIADYRLFNVGESADKAMEAETGSMMMGSTASRATMAEVTGMEKKAENPFEAKGSVVQMDLMLGLHPNCKAAFSIITGLGARTLPGNLGNGPEIRGRAFVGARIDVHGLNIKQTAENFTRARSWLLIAVTRDRAWELTDEQKEAGFEEDLDRLWIDGQLTLFESGARTFRLAPRLTADLPLDGSGPADIRVSLLGTLQLSDLINWSGTKK